MSNFRTQKGGRIRVGSGPGDLTDVSNDIRQLEVDWVRSTVVSQPTPSSPTRGQKASAEEQFVHVEFATNPHDTDGAWALIRAAEKTVTSELYFDAVQGPGAVSASNPKITGYMVVTKVSAGNPVPSSVLSQSATFPGRAISDPITSE